VATKCAYQGRKFTRHLEKANNGKCSRMNKRPSSTPAETGLSVKRFFTVTPTKEKILEVRRAQCGLIATGTVAISKFESPEMREFMRSIISAILPATDSETVVQAMATSARTLTRLAESENKELKRMICEKAKDLAESGQCCLAIVKVQNTNKLLFFSLDILNF
jgi:glycine/serine hydroxymethyltransferase